MTAFIIPRKATPDDIEAARPYGAGDRRWSGDRDAGRWVPDTEAANRMPEAVAEPDPERRLRGQVAMAVKPAVSGYRKGQTSHASADDFRAAVLDDVRGYAAEMGLDIEAAVAEARRQLEAYDV